MVASARPPFDAELEPALNGPCRRLHLAGARLHPGVPCGGLRTRPIDDVIAGRPVEVADHVVTGHGGGEIIVSVLRRSDHEVRRVRVSTSCTAAAWSEGAAGRSHRCSSTGSSSTMRSRRPWSTVSHPSSPTRYPSRTASRGSSGSLDRADEFAFDPRRVLIGGQSAGGGLSAGVTLLARDRGVPMPAAMLLMWPMLDDRNETVSARQIDGVGIWDRTSNETGWTALLGDRRGTADVSSYAAPARASDLSGLPPAYIEAGSAEVFRDEAVAFASGIWAAGGSAELHIWAGGFHGFQGIVPTAAVSRAAVQTREAWVRRMS